ncbi:hypothetical protein [Pontibacillus halophilus]|uniref:hypothetical protein n=1 Tax=Pontibacillus halophilus TaxID=516704 RepID=UPI00041BDACE|nr:hypothetical protein [Pontibacillus halophilus]
MAKTLAMWMTIMISLNIMFAPILYSVESLQRQALHTVLQEGAKKASIEGRFTNEIITEMKNNLVEDYNFDEDDIVIEATQTLTTRENFIEANIEVPRGMVFIFNIFDQGPDKITDDVRIMSEY